jgi:tetratricopeptide (TPR) repeat protein
LTRLGVAAGLVVLCLAVFGQTLRHDFLRYDDAIYVTENPNLQAELSLAGVWRAFREPYEANWIPLTWISLHVDRALFGFEPAGFHAMNLLQHALAAVLLFLALQHMTGAPGASAFTAAVFAVHPLHVESVAWVAERKDTLSGLCFAAALLAYARYAERPGVWRYALVVAATAAGLLAKPMLVTLPCVLLLLDFWPRRRLGSAREIRRALLEKIPLLALAGAAGAAALYAQQSYGSMEHGDVLPFRLRIANAVVSLVAYLRDAVWPAKLAVFYPYPVEGIAPWRVTAATGLLLAITAAAIALRRARPYLLMGWLWFLGMLVPVLGLLQVGMQARADRYMYLPLIGVAIAVAWRVHDGVRRPAARRAASVAGLAAIAGLAVVAHAQTRHWRDTEALFRHAIAVTGENGLAQQWLGSELLRRGALDEAEQAFQEAARLHPRWMTPRRGLADIAAERGDWRAAILGYERALRMAPKDARGHMRLARALAATGQLAEALGRARHALSLSDGVRRPEALLVLGFVHAERGETDEAVAAYDEAIALRPDLPGTWAARGVALLHAGSLDAAQESFARARELGDDSAELRMSLGEIAQRRGDAAQAAAHFREAEARATARGDAALAARLRAALAGLGDAPP